MSPVIRGGIDARQSVQRRPRAAMEAVLTSVASNVSGFRPLTRAPVRGRGVAAIDTV
jgi:hypothetical protein